MSILSSEQILSTNETTDDLDSLASSSVVLSSTEDIFSIVSDITYEQHLVEPSESQCYTNISELPLLNDILISNNLKEQFEQIPPSNTYNNISVTNSSNVVFGNVIKVKGVLNINVYNKNKRDHNANKDNVQEKESFESTDSGDFEQTSNDENISICTIIPRNCWLALEPFGEYKYIVGPVDTVIICHTGSESSTSTAKNMEFIRNIQTFHVDSQGWDDIGYNFLIGCDGNVYEGRGWGVVGVHTYGYNSRSVGITFIGCFMRTLPTQKALVACKNLLQLGVNKGHLTSNYKLLGHRQCISTISPGRLLFEEISNWDHFCGTDNNDN